jgi:hypothetical protein
MPKMTEVTCKCGCGRKKAVRTADVKRGWGKFYSKSCKAKHQERRTGQYKRLLNEGGEPAMTDHEQALSDSEEGWDAHKAWL